MVKDPNNCLRVEGTSLVEKGIQIALRYLENKLTRLLINRGVLIKLTQSQNNYSNLHFYCSTLVFNIYFFEFAKLLGGVRAPPAPPHATALGCHRSGNAGLGKKIILSQGKLIF